MNTKLVLLDTVKIPKSSPAGLTLVEQYIWINDYASGKLFQITVENSQILNSLQCPGVISGLTWDGHSLWQTRMDEDWLQRINPRSLDFDTTLPIQGGSRLSDAAWYDSQLWVVSQAEGKLSVIDPETGRENNSIKVPVGTTAIDITDSHIWISYPNEMIYDANSDNFVWSGEERNFQIAQMTAENGHMVANYRLDFLPTGLAWHNNRIWLSNSKFGMVGIYELKG